MIVEVIFNMLFLLIRFLLTLIPNIPIISNTTAIFGILEPIIAVSYFFDLVFIVRIFLSWMLIATLIGLKDFILWLIKLIPTL